MKLRWRAGRRTSGERCPRCREENRPDGESAAGHYLNGKRNKERVADELPQELLEELSTPELPMERGETTVGLE